MVRMSPGRFARLVLLAPALMFAAPAAQAGVGDLLVAPTRIVLDGRRGTEVILNNIGDDVATYRVSVELRRMTPDGRLADVAAPSDAGKDLAYFRNLGVTTLVDLHALVVGGQAALGDKSPQAQRA